MASAKWTLRYAAKTEKQLRKIDKPTRLRILDYMDSIERLEDPTQRGKPLAENLAGLWRYRVGDYRVICDIRQNELIILAIHIDHRGSVYR